MKIIGNIGSIRKDSNVLVSSTFSDWSAIREGTFIKFDNDPQFYIVSHTEKRVFLKDFVAIQPNILKIDEDCGINIGTGDNLNISFKEYELETIYKVISAGYGYKEGEKLILGGGIPSSNILDNTLNSSTLIIEETNNSGEIIKLKIKDRGKYIITPDKVTDLKDGTGHGASIEVSYKLTDHRSFIERDVEKVEFKNGGTIVHLVYGVPNSIKEGKLSIEKWEMIFGDNYQGENKINCTFQVTRDFTPNYKIPLLTKNAQNPESSINHTLALLDSKIAQLEERIKLLEKKTDTPFKNTKA